MRRSIIFIIVICITCGIIALAHAVVYEALAAIIATLLGTELTHIPHTVISVIFYLFIFLAISFTVATFISMKWNNRAVRAFYIFSAVWTGFLIYFFFAAFVYGVLVMLFIQPIFILPYSIPLFSTVTMATIAWVGVTLFVGAFFVGLHGIFHGNTIQITRVNVRLPNLPPSWKNRTAVFVSDLHLGHVRGAHFAKKVVDKIVPLKSDIVFIGGDLYDGSKVDAVAVIEPLRTLTGVLSTVGNSSITKRVPLGVYFVMGNHEEFGGQKNASRYAAALRTIGARILEDEAVNIDGMRIIGVDHGHSENAAKFSNILEKIIRQQSEHDKQPAKNMTPIPSILLKHEPRDLDIAARAGIDFQISGHTHHGQIFPVSWVTKLVFKAYEYGLHEYSLKNDHSQDADHTHSMQVYTSSGVGTWGPPLRLWTTSEIALFTFI